MESCKVALRNNLQLCAAATWSTTALILNRYLFTAKFRTAAPDIYH